MTTRASGLLAPWIPPSALALRTHRLGWLLPFWCSRCRSSTPEPLIPPSQASGGDQLALKHPNITGFGCSAGSRSELHLLPPGSVRMMTLRWRRLPTISLWWYIPLVRFEISQVHQSVVTQLTSSGVRVGRPGQLPVNPERRTRSKDLSLPSCFFPRVGFGLQLPFIFLDEAIACRNIFEEEFTRCWSQWQAPCPMRQLYTVFGGFCLP